MSVIYCPACRLEQPETHDYCLRCGMELPVQILAAERAKSTRFFPGVKLQEADLESGFLRVSCYREDQIFESDEGSVTIPGHHVRFSIWDGAQARCALSVPESEARDLATFITSELDRVSQ